MGMFDCINFTCGSCGKETGLQTKALEDPDCSVYVVGDKIHSPVDTDYLPERYVAWPKLWDCECGASFVVDFTGGVVNVYVWDRKEDIYVECSEDEEG